MKTHLNELFAAGQKVRLKDFGNEVGEIVKVTKSQLKVSLNGCTVTYKKITNMDGFLMSLEVVS